MSTATNEVEMIISVNGESTKIPPGFRFHPTEEELLLYYLRKKIASQNIDLDVIRDIDLNKLEPWDIQEKCKIGSGQQNEWYLFSHKDKKYPTGTRTNRATSSGFWKATGRDKVIRMSSKRIGMRKTLVFYKGRAPHGLKSDWIMHEYRLTLDHDHHLIDNNDLTEDSGPEEGWVVCRVFKKKNMHNKQTAIIRTTNSQCCSSSKPIIRPTNDAILDQILHYMGKPCKLDQNYETKNILLNNFSSFNTTTEPFLTEFSNLPSLDNVSAMTSPFECDQTAGADSLFKKIELSNIEQRKLSDTKTVDENNNELNDWIALDRLIASQLNGQDNDTPTHFSCYESDLQENLSFSQINNDFQLSNQHSSKSNFQEESQVYNNNLWNCFTQSPPSSSSSDPLAELSI